ncbi:Basic 7S globulin [Camellia lanceoleosa]|uniref:Basic 7S globulin n=1 Tax=Camellia lanceoleosa TaxID=1840588 RepID=A0ACC0IP30_9ERIC|nr:Basic 7S globulin [Camellia lanceoleosa]
MGSHYIFSHFPFDHLQVPHTQLLVPSLNYHSHFPFPPLCFTPTMSSSQTHFFFLFLSFLISHTFSEQPSTPTALVLPISKHALTLQYTTILSRRTPLVPLNVVVDLNGPFLWISCDSTYNSSTYKSVQCHSPLCSLAHSNKLGCNHYNTCIVFSKNVFTNKVSAGELSEDVLGLNSTNGLNPISMVSIPQFLFSCAPAFLSRGLASGAKGVAGLGHTKIALPTQLANAYNFTRKFSMCLSPSPNDPGVLFFGDGPYVLLPGIDISKLLTFTPLIQRPRDSNEYYIRVKSIRVNGKQVPINSSMLMISTVNPYAIIESSIYSSLTRVFIEEALAANVARVESQAPFDVCFSTKNTNGAMIRPGMPLIDLVLQNEKVFWRIFEINSMVPVGNDTVCLGFLDGGLNPRASIILGGYQLEDNLLQFDLESSRLGFTSSLLLRETNCASFNFTN